MRKRGPIAVGVVAGSLFLGALIYGSLQVVKTECELCVEFNGRRECRTGSGTTAEDARRAAQRAACAVMASGMDATIACENRPPEIRRCRT